MPLTDTQRRVLANLSIPRNVEDLASHVRPYVTDSAEGLHELLKALDKDGLVVNVGEYTDSAKLASAVQRNKSAMDLPDEKAELYARRMERPDLVWRLSGEQWMLTKDGLAALHAVPEDAPPPMSPQQVQGAIDAEWARTYRGSKKALQDPDGSKLAGAFASEEDFLAWAKPVAEDSYKRWNVRPRLPLAGGASGWSDAYEVSIIDCENQKTTLTAAAPWYMALSILAFTDADTGTTADDGSHKPTYTGYARAAVAAADMPSATSGAGSAANTTAIVFAACTAGTSTILACANTSALTVGTLRKWGDVASTVISTTQTPAQFAIGAYVTTAA